MDDELEEVTVIVEVDGDYACLIFEEDGVEPVKIRFRGSAACSIADSLFKAGCYVRELEQTPEDS